MIYIRNTQRKFKFDLDKVYKDTEKILELLKYKDFDISVWFTNNKAIRFYNRTYRNKDKATDILSFQYHDIAAGKRIKPRIPEDKNLGDLIISVEYVDKEAKKLKVTLSQRIQRLIVHGICHLLGYDHINDDDWRCMRAKEGWLLAKLKQ